MEIRKVQEMGGGTLLVSLPKKWVIQNKIEKGSIITFEEAEMGRLILLPERNKKKENKQAIIKYPVEYMEVLFNLITGNYLLGVDIIRIQGKNRIKYEDREIIKKAIRNLIGLEILEESANSIMSQFLIEPNSLDARKIIRRMQMISKGMCHDAIISTIESDEHLRKIVAERDDEVDRLYFLLVRLIRSAAQDSVLASRFGMSQIDCLDFRVAANLIEGIGDVSIEIANESANIQPQEIDDEIKKSLTKALETLDEMLEISMNRFLDQGESSVIKLKNNIEELDKVLNQIKTDATSKNRKSNRALLEISLSIDKVAGYCRDLSDLTGPSTIINN